MIILPAAAAAGLLSLAALLATVAYYFPYGSLKFPWPGTQRDWIRDYETILQQSMGIRCEIPELDPFDKEITKYNSNFSDIRCLGPDWVKCYHSKCRVVDDVKDHFRDIMCTYRDILYQRDNKYSLGPLTTVGGDDFYALKKSDFVKVECVGTQKEGKRKWYTQSARWSGNAAGFRAVRPPPAPPGRERTPNVLIFGFDSASRHAFIRHMPKSWKMLKDIGTTVMEGFNVLGEGTHRTLLPLLTGHSPIELPYSARLWKRTRNPLPFDPAVFIFSKLQQDGYRTAFFEDRPDIGTFSYRFNGFENPPTDHYLRMLLMADWFETDPLRYWCSQRKLSYCLGDSPQFKVMINLTQQFLELDGKRFIFTFISDITHDKFDMIQLADDDTAAFLRGLLSRTEDTLIVVMGDHGPRFTEARNTLQGSLEHHLPLLAVRLPDRVRRARPHAQRALERNARALTTPHDLHATILDVLGMTRHWNPYTVKGAGYTRGLTMLQPIPRNRTCSEAGIVIHYCACLSWQNVPTLHPMYNRTSNTLIDYINSLLATVGLNNLWGSLGRRFGFTVTLVNCFMFAFTNMPISRMYKSVKGPLCNPHSYFYIVGATAAQKYAGLCEWSPGARQKLSSQVQIVADPAGAMFEATMTYSAKEDKFAVEDIDVTRTNAYGSEPACLSVTQLDLNPYCYCRDARTAHQQHNKTAD